MSGTDGGTKEGRAAKCRRTGIRLLREVNLCLKVACVFPNATFCFPGTACRNLEARTERWGVAQCLGQGRYMVRHSFLSVVSTSANCCQLVIAGLLVIK